MSLTQNNLETLMNKRMGEDDEQLNVYYIREDILQRVMDQVTENHYEEQTIAIVTQCAYNAIVQFISLNHYHHEPAESFSIDNCNWKSDELISPSEPDTWACYRVPIILKEKYISTKTSLEESKSDSKLVSSSENTNPELIVAKKESDHHNFIADEIEKCINVVFMKKSWQAMSSDRGDILPSPSSSRSQDKFTENGDIDITSQNEQNSYESSSQYGDSISDHSSFSKVAKIYMPKKGSEHFLPSIVPKMQLPDKPRKKESLPENTLPPIRVDTKYNAIQKILEDVKTTKNKKKK